MRQSVDYIDGDQTTYKAFELEDTYEQVDGKTHRFDTGDPIVDRIDLLKFCLRHDIFESGLPFTHSSSLDHFFMDKGKKGKWVELVIDGFDYVALEGMKDIEDLKKYYKEHAPEESKKLSGQPPKKAVMKSKKAPKKK